MKPINTLDLLSRRRDLEADLSELIKNWKHDGDILPILYFIGFDGIEPGAESDLIKDLEEKNYSVFFDHEDLELDAGAYELFHLWRLFDELVKLGWEGDSDWIEMVSEDNFYDYIKDEVKNKSTFSDDRLLDYIDLEGYVEDVQRDYETVEFKEKTYFIIS